jgi:hypothetical protein
MAATMSVTHRISHQHLSHVFERRNLADRVREVGVEIVHALFQRVDCVQRGLHFGAEGRRRNGRIGGEQGE